MNRFLSNSPFRNFLPALLLPALLCLSCAGRTAVPGPQHPAGDPVVVDILQMNDIYELSPVSGGREGGLARVAAIRKQLLAENPNTLTVLAGDLLSPSALGTAKVGGERLNGKQIVAVMNTLGLDFITFGNHEFDLPEYGFLDRLKESRFTWISGNVRDRRGANFPGVLEEHIVTLRSGGGSVRLGIVGYTVDGNPAPYVSYRDVLETARAQVASLRGRVDVVVALTHLPLEQDAVLARDVPGIDLILGGHEHENFQIRRGPDFVPVFKADANARTVYLHRIVYDPATKRRSIRSKLRRVTAEVPEDPETAAAVREWEERGFAAFRAEGFRPEAVVAVVPEALDGLESSVRNRPTELTRRIAEAMKEAVPGAQLSIFNSGSVRIDDVLPPGPLTEYDLIRILPFGGKVCKTGIAGRMLRKVLDQGVANRGAGGFLQTAGVERAADGWRVDGKPLSDDRTYLAAVNDFLLSGKEQNLEFFSGRAEGVEGACPDTGDIRFVLREHLRHRYGKQ